MEWRCLGTLFSGGEGPDGLRADPSLAFCGNVLCAACRAGGADSRNDRDARRILCRRIPDFRRLVSGVTRL